MRRAVPLILGVCFIAVSPAWAKLCGDAVDGKDIPCACGDIVASDLVLDGDPVTTVACTGDGLVVRASDAAAGVTIDLNGKTLRGGDHGAGLWVVDGGPGGATVVSRSGRGAIEGFRDGIVGRGVTGVARLENVDVRRSGRDGVRLEGDGYEVLSVVVENAGRDAFSLDGSNYRCDASRASGAGRFGFFINGDNAIIGKVKGGDVAERAGEDGFHLLGSRHRLNVCTATGSQKDGVSLRGAGLVVTGCSASSNGVDGISGEGSQVALYSNRADGNGRNGLVVTGLRLEDGGGNSGSGNRGEGQQRPAVQCEIGSTTCKP